jgi:hypothetical protein
MLTADLTELRTTIDARLNSMIEQFYSQVPGATHQRDSQEINLEYYKRHSIETILRIRHKRMIDALVIHYFTKHDPRQAKAWANYIEDEMLHGQMFAKDMERLFGLSIDIIYQHEPLFATKLLNGYFYYTLEHEGPMASIASAYFLEYTTRMTQPQWLNNLARIFGEESVKGARAHVNHDIKEDHNDFVWEVLISTIKENSDVAKLKCHFENIFGLFAAYFNEIYLTTMESATVANANVGNYIPGLAIDYANLNRHLKVV